MTKKLKMPAGTTEVNLGTESMPVALDGIVTVPDEAVDALVKTGGATVIEEPDLELHIAGALDEPVQKRLLAKMTNPDKSAGASWDGLAIVRDDDGFYYVPHAAVEDLTSHGFVPVEG